MGLYSGADFLTRIIEEAVLNGAQEKEIACDAPHKRKREEGRRKIKEKRGMRGKKQPVMPRRREKEKKKGEKSERNGA